MYPFPSPMLHLLFVSVARLLLYLSLSLSSPSSIETTRLPFLPSWLDIYPRSFGVFLLSCPPRLLGSTRL